MRNAEMNDRIHTSGDAVFDEACSWFARLGADEVSQDERDRFDLWLARDPKHRSAWREVQELFALTERPAKLLRARRSAAPRLSSYRPLVRLRAVAWTKAAALLLFVGSLGFGMQSTFWQDWQSDFHTSTGRQQLVTLADGSRLLLNTDTAVKVSMEETARHVELLRGEAFFEVTHAAERPFWVDAGAARARVTGTAFSVGRESGAVTVTVAEGRVETSGSDGEAAPVPVTPGLSIRYRDGRLDGPESVDLGRELAWRQGQLIFMQTPLSQVVDQINRYRPGHILLVSDRLRDRPVTAVFSLTQLDDAVAALERTFDLKAKQLTRYLVFLGDP